jgi:hypothetical protein
MCLVFLGVEQMVRSGWGRVGSPSSADTFRQLQPEPLSERKERREVISVWRSGMVYYGSRIGEEPWLRRQDAWV